LEYFCRLTGTGPVDPGAEQSGCHGHKCAQLRRSVKVAYGGQAARGWGRARRFAIHSDSMAAAQGNS
jgi:hypothetical protein